MINAIAGYRAEPSWLEGALAGHRASLARAIAAVEDNTADAPSVLQSIYTRVGRALVVGFTGAPGAGKSTLVSACIAEARRLGLKVGVVAIDPSSPITGSAVLGDRIRMLSIASDDGVTCAASPRGGTWEVWPWRPRAWSTFSTQRART